jgi:alpha-D-xyloside xylohydrolase
MDKFPDAPGFLKEIHDRGLMTCCWINPFVAQESRLFEEGKKGGYFLHRTDGSVWQTDDWQ